MRKIKGFDGVRALCALAVLLGHAGLPQVWFPSDFAQLVYLTAFSHTQAVTVFFVLSGYLISSILLREKEATGKISIRNFLLRRILRLVPAYLLYLGVLGVLVGFGVLKVGGLSFLAALTYTHNYLPKPYGSGHTNHLWSLSVEEQFYLIFPFLLRRFTLQHLRFVIGGLLLAGMAAHELLPLVPLPAHEFIFEGEPQNLSELHLYQIWRLDYWIFPAGLYCLIGCLAGLHTRSLLALPILTHWRGLPGLLLAIVLYLHPVVYRVEIGGMSNYLQCFGLALFFLYLHRRQQGLLVRLLEIPPLPYLGLISYGTYVWHGIFLTTGRGGWHYWWQGLPWGFVFTYGAAILSFHLAEQPFLRLKHRYRPSGVISKA